MKSNQLVKVIAAMFICVILTGCAGESLTITGASVDSITYSVDDDTKEARATGYVVRDGNVKTTLLLPDVIEVTTRSYNVVAVADAAFINGSWVYVEICSSIKSIGARAFAGCKGIKTITLYGTAAPIIQTNTFDDDTYRNATLVIRPDCNIEGTYWSDFKHIVVQ